MSEIYLIKLLIDIQYTNLYISINFVIFIVIYLVVIKGGLSVRSLKKINRTSRVWFGCESKLG